jgi:FkbM family methyltransferase
MFLWTLIKRTLQSIGIEAMGRTTHERLQREALVGRTVFKSTLNIFRLLVQREFPDGCQPMVLQIGANDGQRGDALWSIRDVCHWQGILVEPQPEAFKKLQSLHQNSPGVICENLAIGPTQGTLTLYRVRLPDGSLAWDDLTAASREKLERTLRYLFIDASVEPFEVPTVTSSFLLQKHGITHLDILVVDTEGMDAEIILAFDFERYRPTIVQFEIVHLNNDEITTCLDVLARHGYVYAVAERDVIAWLPPEFRDKNSMTSSSECKKLFI